MAGLGASQAGQRDTHLQERFVRADGKRGAAGTQHRLRQAAHDARLEDAGHVAPVAAAAAEEGPALEGECGQLADVPAQAKTRLLNRCPVAKRSLKQQTLADPNCSTNSCSACRASISAAAVGQACPLPALQPSCLPAPAVASPHQHPPAPGLSGLVPFQALHRHILQTPRVLLLLLGTPPRPRQPHRWCVLRRGLRHGGRRQLCCRSRSNRRSAALRHKAHSVDSTTYGCCRLRR